MDEQYIWLFWATAFLIPWLILYGWFPRYRAVMLRMSLITMLFGLTEPLFVPEYWSPPSLFNLALKTGFDLESLIFCFGIGGVGAVFYNVVSGRNLYPVSPWERHLAVHRYHLLAISIPFIVFPILAVVAPWNIIYTAIIAMVAGGIANGLCRRDLALKSLIGSALFLAYYTVFIVGLEWLAPGYIERVWNIAMLSGLFVFSIPLEELLFAASFGYYWSGLYEHISWQKDNPTVPSAV